MYCVEFNDGWYDVVTSDGVVVDGFDNYDDAMSFIRHLESEHFTPYYP